MPDARVWSAIAIAALIGAALVLHTLRRVRDRAVTSARRDALESELRARGIVEIAPHVFVARQAARRS